VDKNQSAGALADLFNAMPKSKHPISPKGTKASQPADGPVVLNGYDAWMPRMVTLGTTRKLHDKWNMVSPSAIF